MTQFVARAKWDAWNALGQSTKNEAQKKYIEVVKELAGASGTGRHCLIEYYIPKDYFDLFSYSISL